MEPKKSASSSFIDEKKKKGKKCISELKLQLSFPTEKAIVRRTGARDFDF